MKLVSLKVAGFRGFAEPQTFRLDADAIIVVGANGQGKTSFFDAILWALCGACRGWGARIPVSFQCTRREQARVELRLREGASGKEFTIIRSFDGTERRVALETNDNKYQGPSAEGHIIDEIWPDAALATDPGEALASVVARGVYLQQDLIRQFVEAANDQERFTAVSELMGAGRVTELQTSLERAKRAWSTTTNQREDEVGPLRERLAVITGRLTELEEQASHGVAAITKEDWAGWWSNLTALGVTTGRVEAGSREAARAIDDAMKQIETMRRSAERRLESLKSLRAEISRLANWRRPSRHVSPAVFSAMAI